MLKIFISVHLTILFPFFLQTNKSLVNCEYKKKMPFKVGKDAESFDCPCRRHLHLANYVKNERKNQIKNSRFALVKMSPTSQN